MNLETGAHFGLCDIHKVKCSAFVAVRCDCTYMQYELQVFDVLETLK